MENEKKPAVEIKRTNLEYFQKLQDFIQNGRSIEDFRNMFKTYHDRVPTEGEENNFISQQKNLEQYNEQEESYEDSYDDSYDD